jgi:hypothetical protein
VDLAIATMRAQGSSQDELEWFIDAVFARWRDNSGRIRGPKYERQVIVECGSGDHDGFYFEATRTDARYCTNACRQKAYRRRKAATERSGEALGLLTLRP